MVIWVVIGTVGEYSDQWSVPVIAFHSEAEADDFAAKANARQDAIDKETQAYRLAHKTGPFASVPRTKNEFDLKSNNCTSFNVESCSLADPV